MRWTAPGGTAIEVPGTAALNKTGFAQVNSVSCARPGNCGAGGSYTDNSGNQQAFVVSEVDGTWGTAEEVPGIAALAQGGYSDIASVWCARAGTCGAGGIYSDGSGSYQAFVVSETNGTWGTAEQVPVTAALNQGGYAYVQSVSCAPAGNCGAGGQYTDSSGRSQAFVVTQTNGTWGHRRTGPRHRRLNQGGYAFISEVSCAPAGTCAAGGGYTDSSGNGQAFVVNKAYQQPGPRQAAVSPRHAPARPWHLRAPATCHRAIAGSTPRGPVLPLARAERRRAGAVRGHTAPGRGVRW